MFEITELFSLFFTVCTILEESEKLTDFTTFLTDSPMKQSEKNKISELLDSSKTVRKQ